MMDEHEPTMDHPRADQNARKWLVLFVHGLGGHRTGTWGLFPDIIRADKKLAPLYDVGFFAYPSSALGLNLLFWKPKPRIQIAADGLKTAINVRFPDYERIVLVGHSLGGLVIRKYLLEEIRAGRTIRAREAVLFAVPNDGSDLASLGKHARPTSIQLRQACKASDFIHELNTGWSHPGMRERIRWKYVCAGRDVVVDNRSAAGFWGNPDLETDAEADHFNLVKPRDADATSFLILRQFLLGDPPPLMQQAVAADRAPPARAWNVPYPRNSFFSGREKAIESVRNALTESSAAAINQPLAISGIGGIGKTQTAVEYAYRFRSEYKAVFWVRSESEAAITESYLAMAPDLGLDAGADAADVIESVRGWLEKNPGWLLIYDNLDDPEIVRPFRPLAHLGHILITTRSTAIGAIAHNTSLQPFSDEVGAEFLLHRGQRLPLGAPLEAASIEDIGSAMTLVAEMGGLPLALDQAGAYIVERSSNPTRYLELYREKRKELLDRRGRLSEGDHPSVTVTFTLALERVEEASRESANLVRLCAFLGPDSAPDEIFSAGIGPLQWDDIVDGATRYALLVRSEDQTLSMHRLAQAVVRDGMDESDRLKWMGRAVTCVASAFPEAQLSTWPRCERLAPHAIVCRDWIESAKIVNRESGALMNGVGIYFKQRARYAEAERCLRLSLDIWQALNGLEDHATAVTQHNLADLLHRTGMYEEAQELYETALATFEKTEGAESLQAAATLHDLALLHEARGTHREAERLLQRALDIREKALGLDSLEVATSLDSIAVLLCARGKLMQAEMNWTRALAIYREKLDPDDLTIQNVRDHLAGSLSKRGMHQDAEAIYREIFAIRERRLGADHPDTAEAQSNLAASVAEQGNYSEAERLLRAALSTKTLLYGDQSHLTAGTMLNLAGVLRLQNRLSEAEELYVRAVEIRKRDLGAGHRDTAWAEMNLAGLYDLQGRFTEAEPLHRSAILTFAKRFGPDNPTVAGAKRNFGDHYVLRGMAKEADDQYRGSLYIFRGTYGDLHVETRKTQECLERLQRAVKAPSQGE